MKPTVLALSLIALIGTAFVYHQTEAKEPLKGDFAIETLSVPNVILTDQNGIEHSFPGPITKNKIVVINFNYTTCHSICPIGNSIMSRLDALIPADAQASLLSVTINPAHDTPIQMRRAASKFDVSERWYWLTGDVGEVKQLLAAFAADVYDIELHDPIFLVGDIESGRFYRSLSMPTSEELAALVEHARS